MTVGHEMQRSWDLLLAVLLLLTILGSLFNIGATLLYTQSASILSTGTITYDPPISVAIDTSKVAGLNNLSLGFMLDFDWKTWRNSYVLRTLAQDANFKLVRLFDYRRNDPALMPVEYWNETTKTGTFNWTNVDTLVQGIFEIGAEPLICLGRTRNDSSISNYIPSGMAFNPETLLPYPESYAAYATEWVKHFKAIGRPVRFYEIFNEPHVYFGWSANYTKLGFFKDVWNVVARAMRAINRNILISFDFITAKRVLDYWIQNGDDVDYIDSHKYDANAVPGYDDDEILRRAETLRFEEDYIFYGFKMAREKWFGARGKLLPVMISESNLNAAYENGTDPRIQQVIGAVRTALVLRKAVLNDVSYHVYYRFSSSVQDSPLGCYGFGMVNSDNNQPWYPYYVQQLIGSNLGIGCRIISTTSSSEDIRPLAWINMGKLSVLLICRIDQSREVCLQGVSGRFNLFRIDGSVSFLTPRVQTGFFDSAKPLIVNGYTVVLLQAQV